MRVEAELKAKADAAAEEAREMETYARQIFGPAG